VPVEPIENATQDFSRFLHAHWLKILGISALILVPCFWHREIVSSDLGSHLYNAWLAQLIRHGQAPGLWLAPQRTNVLFDYLLSGLGSMFGLHAAEKIAVSLSVLIFFWGSFALISTVTRRAPWFLTPCIALVTYGWTFHLGFFNYYLSLGLSFFCIAILWRGREWERLVVVVIAPLVLVAHPLGFVWLVSAAAYIALAEMSPRRFQFAVFLLGVAVLIALRYYLWHHYEIEAAPKPFFSFNGADQLVLFGYRYKILARVLLAFALIALVVDIVSRRRQAEVWKNYSIPLQLYVLAGLAVVLLPDAVDFPPPTASIALLTERLTSLSAALGCCLLGAMRPRKWHLAGMAAIAAVFFAFVYQDTAIVNKMEAQVDQLVRMLPPNQRVMATIEAPEGSRILIQHIADRACIGHCFSYGNYEPASSVFRVRALPGNPYVMTDDTGDMEDGEYIVKPQDLPAYQIYQCDESGTLLCIRSLAAGEENDSFGVHPDN
jgi:hypothetical protein